jgi:hypothetical protein
MLFMHEHEYYYLLPQHKIHINCDITIMAILELLPQGAEVKAPGWP